MAPHDSKSDLSSTHQLLVLNNFAIFYFHEKKLGLDTFFKAEYERLSHFHAGYGALCGQSRAPTYRRQLCGDAKSPTEAKAASKEAA